MPGESGVFSFLKFTSPAEARAYLEEYQYDCDSMQQLRMALASDSLGVEISRLDDAEVIDQLAERVVLRQVELAEELEEEIAVIEPEQIDASSSSAPPPLPRSTRKLTWIELKVVWSESGKPVKNVRLVVKTPDGVENFFDTNGEGKVRIDEIEEGACDVRSDLKNVKAESLVDFVAMGEPKVKEEESNGNGSTKAGTKIIATIKNHKVKTGESILSLAKSVGMAWQELAKLNWGTDVPKKINKHLKYDVGCTKKTKDGNNYMFDNSDDPGIILMPTKWEQSGLKTGDTHVIQVAPLPVLEAWQFSI